MLEESSRPENFNFTVMRWCYLVMREMCSLKVLETHRLRMIGEMYMGKSTEWSRQELNPHLRVDFADIHLHMHIQHLNHVDHIFSSKHNSFSLCGILFSNCVILCFCNVCVFFFIFFVIIMIILVFCCCASSWVCECVYEAF